MNIGFDVDGVLTDIQGFNLRHAPLFFKERYGRDVVDGDRCDIRDIFDCPLDESIAYWKKYMLYYLICEPARKDAKRTILQLRADGHGIYIVTKRVFSCHPGFKGKLARFLMRNWLWRNGIKHDGIAFCDNDVPDSKRVACLERGIDILVDDEAVNIDAVAPIAKVICYDASYNRECIGENILRARDFCEVYKSIMELSQDNIIK